MAQGVVCTSMPIFTWQVINIFYMYVIWQLFLYINKGTIQRRCRGFDDWEEFNDCFRVRFKELIDEVCG